MNGFFSVQQRALGFTLGNRRQETGLDVGRLVHARGNTVFQQVDQVLFLTGRRVLQQVDQCSGLLGIQGLGGDTLGCTLFYVLAILF